MNRFWLIFILTSQLLFAQDIFLHLPHTVSGWTRQGQTEMYVGDDLYKLIDGGADIFNEYGFKQVSVQRYSDSKENHIDVEVYEMRDSSSAYGIFSLFTFNTGVRADFIDDAFTGDGFLLFLKGNYYISLSGIGNPDETAFGIKQIAKEINNSIVSRGKPPLASMFDSITKDKSGKTKIAYIKGNLGLYNLSTISFGRDFKVNEGICIEIDGVKNFVFAYADGDTCLQNYHLLLTNLTENGKYNKVFPEKDSCLFEGQQKLIKCTCMNSYVIISVSQSGNDLEEISGQIKNILGMNRREYK